jgi:hypothetical protein
MSNLTSQLFTIPAGEFSAKVRINLTGTRAIASIATGSNLTLDGNNKLFMKVKTYFSKLEEWFYVWNSDKNEDAKLVIVGNKSIPFVPFTDLRGEEEVEFELSEIQTNDVTFEIKYTEI